MTGPDSGDVSRSGETLYPIWFDHLESEERRRIGDKIMELTSCRGARKYERYLVSPETKAMLRMMGIEYREPSIKTESSHQQDCAIR